MIEARKSVVDGKWRAWAEFSRSQVGLLSEDDRAERVPDTPVWVCVATAKTKWEAINAALKILKRRTPQRYGA